MTEEELLEGFSGKKSRGPIEDMLETTLEQAVKGHNPVWFLSLSCWFDNDPSMLYPPFHRDVLCRELLRFHFEPKGDFQGHIFLCPKDTFKTTFGLCYCQFRLSRAKLLEGRDDSLCIRHHKEDFAAADLNMLKLRYSRHPWTKRFHPEMVNLAKRFGNDTEFDLPGRIRDKSGAIEPSVYAVGRKTVTAGWKFGLIFNDDLVTEEQLRSLAEREDAKNCYEFGRIMLDAKRGKELTVGHRWHVEDLYGTLLAAKTRTGVPLYTSKVLSAIDENGDPLTERHSKEWLEGEREAEIARTGSDQIFQAVRLNKPQRTGDVRFDPSWYSWFSRQTKEWRSKVANMRKVLFCDTAHKDQGSAGRGDNAVIGVMGFDYEKGILQKYRLDLVVSDTWDIYDCGRELLNVAKRWGLVNGLFFAEEHGQKSSVYVMQREMTKDGWRGRGVPIKGMGTKNVKADRINAYLMEFKAGRIHTDESLPNLERDKLEHQNWTPQTSHGDDIVDMWALSCHPIVMEELGLQDIQDDQEDTMFGPQEPVYESHSRYSPY